MNIAVLGSGPAGLLAAEACKKSGHKVIIFTKDSKPSVISGAQYIHEAIPGITSEDPDGEVRFHKVGTGADYANKVYGRSDAPTSWTIFPEGIFPIWNMGHIYKHLFRYWKRSMKYINLDARSLDGLEASSDTFPLIISAIPAPVLCHDRTHQFPSVRVMFAPHNFYDPNLGDNYIYYSGDPVDPWYRSSFIFGTGWWEFGYKEGRRMMLSRHHEGIFEGIKPLDTTCTCRPRIVRVGRFGEWKKGRLVHHAFLKTNDALEVASHAL